MSEEALRALLAKYAGVSGYAIMVGMIASIGFCGPAQSEPYVSLGAGAVKALQTSNYDAVEFGTDPWFQMDVAVGEDEAAQVGPVDVGVEVEGAIVPMMPLHGRNEGKGDANHHTADGQSITMGSVMVNVEPQIRLGEGVRGYLVAGAGVGIRDDEPVGPAYQAGVGVKVDVTENTVADASFRYRGLNGIELVGPELRFTWNFDTPFGHKLEGEK